MHLLPVINRRWKGVTGETGDVVIYGLIPVKQTFNETIIPTGYQINEKVFSFIIDQNGRVTGYNSITDQKTPEITKTGEMGTNNTIIGIPFYLLWY